MKLLISQHVQDPGVCAQNGYFWTASSGIVAGSMQWSFV